ncbi:MAG TPA: hypothetical protein VI757_08040 [Bacteroidia bacterium]|nr:hypothetical protein [Bacteroidia bacterium]
MRHCRVAGSTRACRADASKGLTREKEKEYIKYASDYFNNVLASLKKNKATISNLDNRPDWNTLLRRV